MTNVISDDILQKEVTYTLEKQCKKRNNMIERIIDRALLLAASVITSLMLFPSGEVVVAGLITVTAFCFEEYIDNKVVNRIIFYAILILACIYEPMLMFMPAFAYSFKKKELAHVVALLLPVLINDTELTTFIIAMYVFITVLALLLQLKTDRYHIMKGKYISTRDDLTEVSLQLKNRLASVTGAQDAEIKLATLNERNRIAREIHDNVGHLLSSSILQLGAVMIMEKDDNTKKMLGDLKNTLDESMNSIRSSVHDIRDESVDLYKTLYDLVEKFNESGRIEAALQYEMSTVPDIKLKYACIAIVKEALSNIIKHSDATKVIIRLNEHPKLRQLIISDNGKTAKKLKLTQSTGMGLENIRQRTDALNGILNISTDNGFRIFISFPKE